MGNSNSGNHGGKRTTSDMQALDVRKLQRTGQIQAERFGTDGPMLAYRCATQTVCLEWTDCHYGGKRAWWLCPAVGCGRRVAVLYAGRVLACRHCHQLAYKSQRETDTSRAYRRANTLRARLGWVPGVINDTGGKPKGMHWTTYGRLFVEYCAAAAEAMGGASERANKLIVRLERIQRERRW